MNESVNLLVPFREFSAYLLKCRSKLEEILELFIYSFAIFICLSALLYYLIHRYRNGASRFRLLRPTKLPENVSRVLLVTAHPDDECMFFGPTLIALKKRKNCRIFVLCLSRGERTHKLDHPKCRVYDPIIFFQVISSDRDTCAKTSCGGRATSSRLSHKTSPSFTALSCRMIQTLSGRLSFCRNSF